MFHRTLYLVLVASFFLLNGCTVEQKLARAYVKTDNTRAFYLLQPSLVFKYNLKEFEIPGIDTLDEFTKDSVLIENSLFLKTVSDSVVISEFISGVKKTLESYSVVVLPESAIDTLMVNGGTPFIINIAQISLEEYIHPYSTEEQVYDEIIVIDGIDLNALNFNVWIELGRMNTEKNNKVLFASDYLLDEISGTLKQNLITGKMSFDYMIDTITMNQIYESARLAGGKTAVLLFDYLMNDYIGENLPEDYPYDRQYYHYDPVRMLIYPVGEENRIIELDNF